MSWIKSIKEHQMEILCKVHVPLQSVEEDASGNDFFCAHALPKHGHQWHHKTVCVCVLGGGVYRSKAVVNWAGMQKEETIGLGTCKWINVHLFFFCPLSWITVLHVIWNESVASLKCCWGNEAFLWLYDLHSNCLLLQTNSFNTNTAQNEVSTLTFEFTFDTATFMFLYLEYREIGDAVQLHVWDGITLKLISYQPESPVKHTCKQ